MLSSSAAVEDAIGLAIDELRADFTASVAIACRAGLDVALLLDLRCGPAWLRLVLAEQAMELLGAAPLPKAEDGRVAVVVATSTRAHAFVVPLGGPS